MEGPHRWGRGLSLFPDRKNSKNSSPSQKGRSKNNAYLSQGTCKQCHVIFSAFYYVIIKKKMNETSFN